MNQEKVAIDIVLLLPKQIEQFACDLSRKITAPVDTQPLILDGQNYIPHISLLMGTMQIATIELYYEAIEKIVKKYLPLNIVISGLEKNLFPYLKIEKTKELFNLQKEIAESVKLHYDADAQMFINAEAEQAQIDWVNKFLENSSGDKYSPHITLGIGDASKCEGQFPIEATIESVAICHLGYGCSCRKIIKEF